MIARFVHWLENLFFGHRAALLTLLAAITVVMGWFASGLRMDAGFDKQLPTGHEYTDTFFKYREMLFGANRLIVVLHARQGTMWNADFLKALHDVTQVVMFMPGVDRNTVSSLWTPNTRVLLITEEGFQARDVIGGDITPDKLDEANIAQIRENVIVGGYVGSLVANDDSGAMVVADLLDYNPRTREKTDYIELGKRIETEVRRKFENDHIEVQIIGFAKQISDIAEGANVSRAAASRAVRDLAAQDLVEHKAYGYVDLTAKGHQLAGELTARHETICRFLRDVLGFDQGAADEEACRLEHLLEDETVDRLAALASFFEADARARSRWKHHFESGLNK